MSSTLAFTAKLFHAGAAHRRKLEAIARRLGKVQSNIEYEYVSQFHLFSRSEMLDLVVDPDLVEHPGSDNFDRHDILNNMLNHDMSHWLPDQMLVKTDRASMAWSLEARLPFLDNDLVDLALHTPVPLLINNRQLKHVLRQTASRHLPASITSRPKHGFAVPVDQWLRDNPGPVQDWLLDGAGSNNDWIKPAWVEQLWREHLAGTGNHGEKLLTIMLLFVWRGHHKV